MEAQSLVVVGMQWGDEGKGKVIDLLSSQAKHIARAQGGNNAGHTIVANGIEYRFHLIPSGILYPSTRCYIGGGTVIDPASILAEMEALRSHNVQFEHRLFISPYAHVVLPYHKLLDQLSEQRKGKASIGTTGKGIGPCYVDKVQRIGIRMIDLIDSQRLTQCLEATLPLKNEELQKIYNHAGISFEEIYSTYEAFGRSLHQFVAPVEEMLFEASLNKEKILFEGAQGALLDVSFGTYPYVTSSCTLAGGASAGFGFGPSRLGHVIGATKAYTTRVGNGPFPSELKEDELCLFPDHHASREIGTTTGRKRRMGWLDVALLRHTVCLNGADSLAIMKLDILDQVKEIKICIGYKIRGKIVRTFPASLNELDLAEPIYESHPGWLSSIRDVSTYGNLPPNAKAYLRRIEELLNLPISLISVGPEREKTIWMDHFYGS